VSGINENAGEDASDNTDNGPGEDWSIRYSIVTAAPATAATTYALFMPSFVVLNLESPTYLS
jgi:hypothetical protein